MKGYIYKISNRDGLYYIGSTHLRLCTRLAVHKYLCKFPEKYKSPFYRELIKDPDNWTIEALHVSIYPDKYAMKQHEDNVIRQHLLLPECLNKNKALLTVDEKLNYQKEYQRRYRLEKKKLKN